MRSFPALLLVSVVALAGCTTQTTTRTQTPSMESDRPSAPAAQVPADKSKAGLPGQDALPPAQASAVYVCPMHPEVTSDQPGTCPKCGMALVKKGA